MRYIKIFMIIVAFFLSMVFFFQNQASLSNQLTLQLDLIFREPMVSIPLPYYFLLLVAFFVGAILTLIGLILDKLNLSAKIMKANWKIRALEKELTKLQASEKIKPALMEKPKIAETLRTDDEFNS